VILFLIELLQPGLIEAGLFSLKESIAVTLALAVQLAWSSHSINRSRSA